MQAGDIDPRVERGYGYAISVKASAVGSTAEETNLCALKDLKRSLGFIYYNNFDE
jgi:hypothetical protein